MDQTVSRRFEPSSRTALMGEQPNPWDVLPPQVAMSRHRGAKPPFSKLLGVLAMAAVPVGLITVPFIENVNKFQNPFRRPIASAVFLFGTFVSIWLGIGACMPISKALTLGLF